jgi:hypothetical protein
MGYVRISSACTDNDAIRQLQSHRQATDVAVGVLDILALSHFLFDVAVHVVTKSLVSILGSTR